MRNIIIMSLLALFIVSCNPDNDTPESGDKFDRGAMLTNVADNIIIPAYQDLDTKLTVLVSAKNDFITTTDQTNLDALRTSWLNAYKVWQSVEMYNIGEAEQTQYYFQMNIYPTSITDVENNIASGNYDLAHVNNNDAVGFPAVDYMLYGVADTDIDILEKYTTDTNAAKYKTYLSDLVNKMESLTKTVLNDWTSSYRGVFISSTNNTATSSFNKLVNDFIFYYEKGLRANKIGIPAGVFSAGSLPEKVEAFYSDAISKQLSLDALNAVQDMFNGKYYSSATTGSSFKSYLLELNETGLATDINTKLNIARDKIELMNNSFYTQVITDNTKMLQSYDALQNVVILFKVDMLIAFGVNVDYVDGDGD